MPQIYETVGRVVSELKNDVLLREIVSWALSYRSDSTGGAEASRLEFLGTFGDERAVRPFAEWVKCRSDELVGARNGRRFLDRLEPGHPLFGKNKR